MNVRLDGDTPRSLGSVWIDCAHSATVARVAEALETRARVHVGLEPPEGDEPSLVVLCASSGDEGVRGAVRRVRKAVPRALVMWFGSRLDLAQARDALRAGARGYVHAEMPPEQVRRALEVASGGELVAPRQLLEYLVSDKDLTDVATLSTRQREILDLVNDELTNAQIARRLDLTESTVKQHLHSAYKVLGVRNRTEAARLVRDRG